MQRIAIILVCATSLAGVDLDVGHGVFRGLALRPMVESMKDKRSEGVVFQQLDFSCGPAAVATVLTYHFDDVVSELDVIDQILVRGDVAKIIARKGFSLLDLKRFVEGRGYRGDGYQLDLEALAEFDEPVIVPLLINDLKHFVVVRGVRAGHVFIADPVKGRLALPVARFGSLWFDGSRLKNPATGIGFVIARVKHARPVQASRPAADDPQDEWFLRARALRDVVRDRTVVVMPVAGEF